MLTLLHGDHIEASRKELARLRASFVGKEIRTVDGKTADLLTLTQALESSSLFGGDTAVIIENLFTKRAKKEKKVTPLSGVKSPTKKTTAKNETAQIIELLVHASDIVDIVLWEEKELDKTTLTALGSKINIQLCKLPTVIFQFLDSLKPGNAASLLQVYHQVVDHDAPELVWSMLVTRIRQLMMLHDGVVPDRLADWQAARLTNQTKLFTIEKLKHMHTVLIDSEYALKSGSSPFSISQHIEQILINFNK